MGENEQRRRRNGRGDAPYQVKIAALAKLEHFCARGYCLSHQFSSNGRKSSPRQLWARRVIACSGGPKPATAIYCPIRQTDLHDGWSCIVTSRTLSHSINVRVTLVC